MRPRSSRAGRAEAVSGGALRAAAENGARAGSRRPLAATRPPTTAEAAHQRLPPAGDSAPPGDRPTRAGPRTERWPAPVEPSASGLDHLRQSEFRRHGASEGPRRTAYDWDVLVTGGGLFGCVLALHWAKAGRRVALVEQGSRLLNAASTNNQARVHVGYHYPRS